jgi:hypothetical protein
MLRSDGSWQQLPLKRNTQGVPRCPNVLGSTRVHNAPITTDRAMLRFTAPTARRPLSSTEVRAFLGPAAVRRLDAKGAQFPTMTLTIGRPHSVDPELAVAALTYIAERQTRPTLHSVFKVLYDAEKRHLAEYLRPIVGDRYVAMNFGPVPSHLYDLLKHLRDPSSVLGVDPVLAEVGRQHLVVQDRRRIDVLATCDLDALSPSAIECLDAALEQERGMTFGERTAWSHDAAWQGTARNAAIPWRKIAETLPGGPAIAEHLDDPYPG